MTQLSGRPFNIHLNVGKTLQYTPQCQEDLSICTSIPLLVYTATNLNKFRHPRVCKRSRFMHHNSSLSPRFMHYNSSLSPRFMHYNSSLSPRSPHHHEVEQKGEVLRTKGGGGGGKGGGEKGDGGRACLMARPRGIPPP